MKKHCFGKGVNKEDLKLFLNPTDQKVKYTNSSAEIVLNKDAYKDIAMKIIEDSGVQTKEATFFSKGELQIGFEQILSKNLEQCVDLFYIVQQLDFLIKKGSESIDMTNPHQGIHDFVMEKFFSYSYELNHARALQNSLTNTKNSVIQKLVDAIIVKVKANIKSGAASAWDGVGDVVKNTAEEARKGAVEAAKQLGKGAAELQNGILFGYANQNLKDIRNNPGATLYLIGMGTVIMYSLANICFPLLSFLKKYEEATEPARNLKLKEKQADQKHELEIMRVKTANELIQNLPALLKGLRKDGNNDDTAKELLSEVLQVMLQNQNMKCQINSIPNPDSDGDNNNNNRKKLKYDSDNNNNNNKKEKEKEEDEKIKIPTVASSTKELEDDPNTNTGGMKSKKRRPKKVKKTRKKGKKKRKDKKSKKRRGKKVKKTRKKGKKKRKGKKSKRSKK